MAAHESCCERAPIDGSTAQIDKYLVTAGRMRAFIERLDGNVVSYVSGLGTSTWGHDWSQYVPASIADANEMLGPYWSKRSCAAGSYGGHTYYTSPEFGDTSSFTQDDLDPKALNCVSWYLANAFCQWDGGRLPSLDEITNIFTNNSTTAWPWGWNDLSTYNPGGQDFRVNHGYNYNYPGPEIDDDSGYVRDIAWYVSPPGRFASGNNRNGVADAAGNLLEWIDTDPYNFTSTEAWDGPDHPKNLVSTSWQGMFPGTPNGYFSIGFRCAHD
ncbi:MAG: formylglycine-generating enzyme family protein [Polyangiaceae bacterium]|nr:formylglycine-generating enzyme family protein [Polyangiaceae bacterium]